MYISVKTFDTGVNHMRVDTGVKNIYIRVMATIDCDLDIYVSIMTTSVNTGAAVRTGHWCQQC